MLKKIIAQTHCLLSPDEVRWLKIKRLIVELGMVNAEGRVIWKNAGAYQMEEKGLSTSFVPAIWEPKSAEMVMSFEWLTDPAAFGEKKQIIECHYRKLIVYKNGKIRECRVVKFRRRYTDKHFRITIGMADA